MASAAEAFAAVKVLYPEAISIERGKEGVFVKVQGSYGPQCHAALLNTTDLVDLKVDEVYPKPEPKWRKAEWPRDAAKPPKECRLKDFDDVRWYKSALVGHVEARWVCEDLDVWDECEVIDDSQV